MNDQADPADSNKKNKQGERELFRRVLKNDSVYYYFYYLEVLVYTW